MGRTLPQGSPVSYRAGGSSSRPDDRPWILGGEEPTFADITLCTAIAFSKFPVNGTPLDERFEYPDGLWTRWQARPSFQSAYADGGSGLDELAHLKK